MKISVLIILVVLPMLTSIGLYCYGLISTRWSYIDNDLITKYNLTNEQQKKFELNNNNNNTIKIESQIRHGFRSRYGLFGYCLDYKWLNLYTMKHEKDHQNNEFKSNSTFGFQQCNQSSIICRETKSCVCLNFIIFKILFFVFIVNTM
jgi:hypothetical protein